MSELWKLREALRVWKRFRQANAMLEKIRAWSFAALIGCAASGHPREGRAHYWKAPSCSKTFHLAQPLDKINSQPSGISRFFANVPSLRTPILQYKSSKVWGTRPKEDCWALITRFWGNSNRGLGSFGVSKRTSRVGRFSKSWIRIS